MSRVQQIIAGWAIVIGAVGTATLAFPSIAQQAAEKREVAQWQDRAQAFTMVEGVDLGASSLVQTLADLHADSNITNVAMRDRRLLNDFQTITREDMLNAKHQMRENRCLAEAVYYEARSEGLSGQAAVAEVVLNRVKSKHYPNTICGVVYQGAERTTGCQFTFTCDGSTLKEPRGKNWTRALDVATLVHTGGLNPITGRATHYHTFAVDPHWSKTLKITKDIGSHRFYRFRWRERPVSATLRAAPPSP